MPIGTQSFPFPPEPYHPEVNVVQLVKALVKSKGNPEAVCKDMIRQLEKLHFNLALDLLLDDGRSPNLEDEVRGKQKHLEKEITTLKELL